MTHLCCREVSEFLMEFLDNSLADDIREGFQSHVDSCGNCRTFLVQYRETIIAGQLACLDEGPCDCPEELVKAVMAALGKEPRA